MFRVLGVNLNNENENRLVTDKAEYHFLFK